MKRDVGYLWLSWQTDEDISWEQESRNGAWSSQRTEGPDDAADEMRRGN